MVDSPARVLVLDGETRTALATVRSLGAKGVVCGVASPSSNALAFASKYCGPTFISPDASYAPDTYVKWLLDIVESWQPTIVLPLSDLSLKLCLRVETDLREMTILPTVSSSVFESVVDKAQLLDTAADFDIDVPLSLLVPAEEYRDETVEEALAAFPYPAVAKPNSSFSDLKSHFVKEGASYARDASDVLRLIAKGSGSALARVPFLLQEQLFGVGVGVFALCVRGEPVAVFCHRRLLEKPPSGGRSVLSESISEEEAPVTQALALLKHYAWDGVAMVEFKLAADGCHYLMEINPRLWGSLQLAIDCGRDFPALLYELYKDGAIPSDATINRVRSSVIPYTIGNRLRWLLGSLDHLLLRLRSEPLLTIRDTFTRDALYLRSARNRTRWEICRRDDIKPFLRELKRYIVSLVIRERSGD